MTDNEKRIMDDILRYGTITWYDEFDCDGKHIRQYTIIENGEKYDMTKINGEWSYFFHYNK